MSAVIRVMGVDPSIANTGVVVLEWRDGEEQPKVIHQGLAPTKPGKPNFRRGIEIAESLMMIYNKCLDGWAPSLGVEGYAYDNPQNASNLGEIGGVIKATFYDDRNRTFAEIPPTSVKKFATGNGSSKKELILKEVYRKWGFDTNDNNIADAYVIARITLALTGYGPQLLTYEQAVIDALKKEKK